MAGTSWKYDSIAALRTLAGTAFAPSPEGISGIEASTGRPSSASTSASSRRRPSNQSTRNTTPSASSSATIAPIARFVVTCGVVVASSFLASCVIVTSLIPVVRAIVALLLALGVVFLVDWFDGRLRDCLLYTSPSPRDRQ